MQSLIGIHYLEENEIESIMPRSIYEYCRVAESSGAHVSQTDFILFFYAEISGFEAQLINLLCIFHIFDKAW